MNNIIKTEFKKLLQELQNQKINENILNIFSIKRSTKFNQRLMTVGRYITGAHPDCVFKFEDSAKNSEHLISMLEYHECAMNWVSDLEDSRRKLAEGERPFSTRRLPYWRVVRQVVLKGKLTTDSCWSDQTAWTNLYKLSKNGGNPSAELLAYQFESAKKILLQEIIDAKPQNILFLTGWNNWAKPFIEDYLIDIKHINNNHICLTGTLTIGTFECNVIVAEKPYKVNESQMSDTILELIL